MKNARITIRTMIEEEGLKMARKKGFGVSPITNIIFYGTQDTDKGVWVGAKTDVTEDAISAVFDWFVGNMEDKSGNRTEYRITYPDTDYELVMRKKN
mgnify:CR=1 FL=1